MNRFICKIIGHNFKREAPRLRIRLNKEKEYRRHNYCSRCKKLIALTGT